MKILWRTLHWTGLIDSLYGILKEKLFCMGECRLGIYGEVTTRKNKFSFMKYCADIYIKDR